MNVKVKPLVWQETQMGMWWRAEAGGKVYEIPATDPRLKQKMAKYDREYEAYVLSLIDIIK